jgi:hypothetical protein
VCALPAPEQARPKGGAEGAAAPGPKK